jgi:hypothetical protein
MIDTRTMIYAAAAAVLVLAASPAAWAQENFAVSAIGNVYRNPASGCGYGLGYWDLAAHTAVTSAPHPDLAITASDPATPSVIATAEPARPGRNGH